MCFQKRKLPVCIQLFSVSRHNVSPHFHHRCLFQLSLPTFELSFYKTHQSILRNTIVNRDIAIYHKTLHFLENLHSASVMHFTPQLGNQATDRFHFFTVTHLNINIPISGLTSIFIKCGMCWVFAQWVTNDKKLLLINPWNGIAHVHLLHKVKGFVEPPLISCFLTFCSVASVGTRSQLKEHVHWLRLYK